MNESLMQLVRRHDPDRFLTVLFVPAARRDALLALYAFNYELARARVVASDPTLALIRLQWWREVVEGQRKRHEVATPLSDALASGVLRREDLLPLIEARDAEAYGDFLTVADWRNWLLAGAGGLAVAAARALGADEPEAARRYGAAYGVAGLLRATGALAGQGRCLMPLDLLAEQGLSPEAFVYDPSALPARAVLARAMQEGRSFLRLAPPVPRAMTPAVLPAVLARRDFAVWPRVATPRRIGDRLAVLAAALTGRV